MTDASEGPDVTEPDTYPTPEAAGLFEGMSDMLGAGHPVESEGEPERADAVDTSDATEAATDAGDKADAPPEPEVTPEPEQTVNFDGFSDDQKTVWEQLLKEEKVTPEFVEAVRGGTLRMADYTQKRMADAEKMRAWDEETKGVKEDLAFLALVREDDRLHAKWLKLTSDYKEGDLDDESDGEDLVDTKKAREITRNELKADREQREAEQAKLSAHEQALQEVVDESTKLFGVTPEQMQEYLKIEGKRFGPQVKSLLDVSPVELQSRLADRHEVESAKAEAARLREQLSQRTSHDARTAKQSLPPPRRVTPSTEKSIHERLKADFGMDPSKPWTQQVTGIGQ